MINRYTQFIRRRNTEFPKLFLSDMAPKSFKFGIEDIGRQHSLRMWYLQNSPSDINCAKRVYELENLHKEANFHVKTRYQKKVFLFFSLIFFLYAFVFEDTSDKKDFKSGWNLVYNWKLLDGLEDAGFDEYN